MAFFVWCVVLEIILTANQLRNRGIIILEWCFMCKRSVEDGDKLIWVPSLQNEFLVKSYYKFLQGGGPQF